MPEKRDNGTVRVYLILASPIDECAEVWRWPWCPAIIVSNKDQVKRFVDSRLLSDPDDAIAVVVMTPCGDMIFESVFNVNLSWEEQYSARCIPNMLSPRVLWGCWRLAAMIGLENLDHPTGSDTGDDEPRQPGSAGGVFPDWDLQDLYGPGDTSK